MQVFSGSRNAQIISFNNTLFLDWLFEYECTCMHDLPTPKKRGQTREAVTSPHAGTSRGNMQARNVNSSERGA